MVSKRREVERSDENERDVPTVENSTPNLVKDGAAAPLKNHSKQVGTMKVTARETSYCCRASINPNATHEFVLILHLPHDAAIIVEAYASVEHG